MLSNFFFSFIQFRQLAHSLEFNDDESNLIWSGHEKIKLKPSCAKQYLKPIKEFKFPPFIQTLTTCSSAQKKKRKTSYQWYNCDDRIDEYSTAPPAVKPVNCQNS